jgi:hypothetical protein
MNSTKHCALFVGIGLTILATAPCRADLFAVLSTSPEILRIDSATGNVTHTYPFPDWLPFNPTQTVGLAFDGRVVYMNRRAFGFEELWSLDVVNNFWHAPLFIDSFVPPSGQRPLSGLGFLPDGYGSGNLIGVSRNPPDDPPSHIFQYPWPIGFPGPNLINLNFPPGELPPNMAAHGADIDPTTGDLWIAVDEHVGNLIVGRHLLRTDLSGTVLETLTPMLDPVTLIRGVGFDAGGMFIAGRSLPTQTNVVYEIDRVTGAVLRSFALPGSGTLGALTGGEVLPEPGGYSLGLIAAAVLAAMRGRTQSVRRPR